MRRPLAVAAVVALPALLAGCGSGDKKDAATTTTAPPPPVTVAQWTAFPTDDARFRTVWPRQPLREEEDVVPDDGGPARKVIVYKADVAIGEYSVVWADLSGGVIDPPVLLGQVQQDVLDEVKATLQTSTDTTHEGHPAKELVAKMDDGGYIKARIVVTSRDLFIVQATSPVPEPSRFAEFVGALDLL